MNLPSVTEEIQTKLGVHVDGKWGPETAGAVYRTLFGHDPESNQPPAPHDASFTSDRSEKIINQLAPEVQSYYRAVWHRVTQHFASSGITFDFISGYRSQEEQAKLYQAYLNGGPLAAPPGHSFHEFRAAADAGFFKDGIYLDEHPELVGGPAKLEAIYAQYGAIVDSTGLLYWGGHFGDGPHAEAHPTYAAGWNDSQILTEWRRRQSTGENLFA